MSLRPQNIGNLFYAGNHRAVIEQTLDQTTAHYAPADFPFVVGALVYLGRLDEAERLYLMKKKLIEPMELIQCRYFLGLGFCRHSFYAKARKYFYENFTQRRLFTDGKSHFFIFQGLGFYHYFAGRMAKALKNAEKALSASLAEHFLYGRALSMDLKGHTLIQTGHVGPGMETLVLAGKLAEQLGASWLADAIRVSSVSYRARFGIEPKTILKDLSAKLKSLSKQDIYSQSTLLLDLAQENVRRGRLADAKTALNECCRIVYASQNRRHAALLNLRYAYMHYLEGDPHLSLNLIRNALTQIDTEVDVLLELRLRGLEERLVKELAIEKCSKAQELVIDRLTKRVGESVAIRIKERKNKTPLSSQHLGEDPFGDLVDEIKRESSHAIESVIESGYYGLLTEVLPATRGKRVLYLDLEPGALTVFDQGEIEHIPGSISRSLKNVLLELNRGRRTKEELITTIWEYEYHPLRHDALIYSAIAKIRKLLGKRSHWLEVSENGYQFRPEVSVIAYQLVRLSAQEQAETATKTVETEATNGVTLNHRQQKILRFLDQNEFIDTMTCRSLFDTSEITASRDLSELLKLQLIARIGKGRATKYSRAIHGD